MNFGEILEIEESQKKEIKKLSKKIKQLEKENRQLYKDNVFLIHLLAKPGTLRPDNIIDEKIKIKENKE